MSDPAVAHPELTAQSSGASDRFATIVAQLECGRSLWLQCTGLAKFQCLLLRRRTLHSWELLAELPQDILALHDFLIVDLVTAR
jgi:hypothetical protein